MIPKKGEIWRTISYLSDDFYDKTKKVVIVEVIDI